MDTKIYVVAGGWQAEDEHLVMACFGRDAQEAQDALTAARERARLIAERFRLMAVVDEPLTAEDLEDIGIADAEIARGESRRVAPRL